MKLVFSDILTNAFAGHLDDVHIALPGLITSYDYKTKKAQVQPTIKKVFVDGVKVSMPIISDVPVLWPGTSQGVLHFEIKAGTDPCLIIFSERSLENWLSSEPTQILEPGDPRQFHLSDAICIPGLFSFANPGKVAGTGKGMELLWLTAGMTIDDSGLIQLGNANTSLMAILTDLISLLTDMVSGSNWIGNSGAPVQLLTLANDLNILTSMQTKVNQLLQPTSEGL
jgi:hypothetical protein